MLSPNIIIHPTRALITLFHQLFFRAGDDERYPYPANRWEVAASGTDRQYHSGMKRKHQRTLELIFSRPVSGSLPWRDVEALFQELDGR
jgi:hypothetical protein